MKIVKVTYTTKTAYAVQNAENIRNVMSDLRQSGSTGIFYHVCLSPDGKTFTHTAFFNSDEDRKILNDLPSFKRFQEQLMSLGIEMAPQQEMPSLVGSSVDIFNP